MGHRIRPPHREDKTGSDYANYALTRSGSDLFRPSGLWRLQQGQPRSGRLGLLGAGPAHTGTAVNKRRRFKAKRRRAMGVRFTSIASFHFATDDEQEFNRFLDAFVWGNDTPVWRTLQ